MIDFLLLLIFPVLVSIGALILFKGKITLLEFGIQVGVLCLFIGACIGCAYWQDTTDVENWNGQVVSKTREEVSCRHSYKCNCYETCTGTGSSRSCTEHCSTCYEHSYDVDWDVQSSTKEVVSIDTIDRQGLKMPPRWGAAFVGEPWTSRHHYENYIMANPDSVLTGGKGDVEKWSKWHMIPQYPGVFDYYKSNHFINMGPVPVDDHTWNWLVNEINKTLGPKKQVNVLVILVKTEDSSYIHALKTAWIGGKKNDAVIVIGSADGHKIAWAEVMSWAVRADFRDNLRDDIMRIGTLDERDAIVKAINDNVDQRFVRMHMKDMQYLMRSFQPSTGWMWFIFLFATALSSGMSYYFLYLDQENHGWQPRYRRY